VAIRHRHDTTSNGIIKGEYVATTLGKKLLDSFNNVKQGTNKLLQKYPVAPTQYAVGSAVNYLRPKINNAFNYMADDARNLIKGPVSPVPPQNQTNFQKITTPLRNIAGETASTVIRDVPKIGASVLRLSPPGQSYTQLQAMQNNTQGQLRKQQLQDVYQGFKGIGYLTGGATNLAGGVIGMGMGVVGNALGGKPLSYNYDKNFAEGVQTSAAFGPISKGVGALSKIIGAPQTTGFANKNVLTKVARLINRLDEKMIPNSQGFVPSLYKNIAVRALGRGAREAIEGVATGSVRPLNEGETREQAIANDVVQSVLLGVTLQAGGDLSREKLKPILKNIGIGFSDYYKWMRGQNPPEYKLGETVIPDKKYMSTMKLSGDTGGSMNAADALNDPAYIAKLKAAKANKKVDGVVKMSTSELKPSQDLSTFTSEDIALTSGPIHAVQTPNGPLVLDGNHRLNNALKSGEKTIDTIFLKPEEAIARYKNEIPNLDRMVLGEVPQTKKYMSGMKLPKEMATTKVEPPEDIARILNKIDQGEMVPPRSYAKAMQWEEQARMATAPDTQSGRTPSLPDQNPSMLGKPDQGQMQAGTQSQSQLPLQGQSQINPSQEFSSTPIIPQATTRGFTQSVQQAPNVAPEVKAKVNTTYTPKPNTQLMGEAQALLQEGASIKLNNVEGIDKKIAATIQEAINKQRTNPELAANLYNNLSEQGTELGRGVQALSLLQRMSPEAIAMTAASKIKAYNRTARVKIPELGGEQLTMITKMVDNVSKLKVGTREHNMAVNELKNTINKFIPSSIADKAIAVWKAGLLTSLRTTERNLFGNSIHGIAETVKDLPATVADMLMSMATKKRTLVPTVRGVGEFASKQTAQQISDVIKLGYDASADVSKFDHKTINWGNNPLEQAAKIYTNIVFRSLQAQDKPFFNSAFKRSLFSQAGAEAINAGKEGNRQFINSLVSKPTTEMIKTAIEDASTATFKSKNSASAIASTIKRELANVKIGGLEVGKIMGEVAMPFTGVPSSILGQVISYSPAGLLKGIVDVGRVASGSVPELQRKAAQELGRGVIGTGIFALGAYLASKGLITGQPKDAAEQRQWDLENKPRNSIMLGGKWRSLNSIGPESIVFLAGSKFQEEANKPDGSLGAYGGNLAKDYLDQSFVTGLQQPVNVITDPARYGKSYAGSMLSSVVPNILKDSAKATDTKQREANTILDYARQSIPGARQNLIEKRDVLGNEMKQEPTGLRAFFDLFNSKTPVNNAVVNELSRLQGTGENATPSKLTPNQTILKQKVKLTFDQLNNLEKGVGEALRPQLQALIQSPAYQAVSDEEKAQTIDNLVQRVRKQYKGVNGESIISGNGTTPDVAGSQTPIYITDENGNVREIQRSFTEKPPKLTGIKEIDKNKISSYKSKITSRIKDLGELLDRGEMSREDVITELNSLIKLKNAITTASGGGKKLITDAELASAYKKLLQAVYTTPKLKTSNASKNIAQPIRLKRQAIRTMR
jgi:hypothetical protein